MSERCLRKRGLPDSTKKTDTIKSTDEIKLLDDNPELMAEVQQRLERAELARLRLQEVEDEPLIFEKKCNQLVDLIQKSKYIVVFTGAGISTSAQIPDYRGPNGIWTQLKLNGKIETQAKDIAFAYPTFTHMAIKCLHDQQIIKHVVSQNCDGLHVRSGLPLGALSEIHGNMFVETCKKCEHNYYRDFDVTELTAFRRHRTGRKCNKCMENQSQLKMNEASCLDSNVDLFELNDTIIHFGEKSHQVKPYNWNEAVKAVNNCDLIICLGSSLKVLREYKCLWPERNRKIPLVIVNLQWTPKDKIAQLKINAKCDQVMRFVTDKLAVQVPLYSFEDDALRQLYEPLTSDEQIACNRHQLFRSNQTNLNFKSESDSPPLDEQESDNVPGTSSLSGWFGKGLKFK